MTGGPASKLSKIRTVRKAIARILTVINQTQKQELRKFYKVFLYYAFCKFPTPLSLTCITVIKKIAY